MTKQTTRDRLHGVLRLGFVIVGALLIHAFYRTNDTAWPADIAISLGWLAVFWAVFWGIPWLIERVYLAWRYRRIVAEQAERDAEIKANPLESQADYDRLGQRDGR